MINFIRDLLATVSHTKQVREVCTQQGRLDFVLGKLKHDNAYKDTRVQAGNPMMAQWWLLGFEEARDRQLREEEIAATAAPDRPKQTT